MAYVKPTLHLTYEVQTIIREYTIQVLTISYYPQHMNKNFIEAFELEALFRPQISSLT